MVYYRDSILVSFGALEPCLELGADRVTGRPAGDAGAGRTSIKVKASLKSSSIAHIAVLVELVP